MATQEKKKTNPNGACIEKGVWTVDSGIAEGDIIGRLRSMIRERAKANRERKAGPSASHAAA